jgi:hypothetical protein
MADYEEVISGDEQKEAHIDRKSSRSRGTVDKKRRKNSKNTEAGVRMFQVRVRIIQCVCVCVHMECSCVLCTQSVCECVLMHTYDQFARLCAHVCVHTYMRTHLRIYLSLSISLPLPPLLSHFCVHFSLLRFYSKEWMDWTWPPAPEPVVNSARRRRRCERGRWPSEYTSILQWPNELERWARALPPVRCRCASRRVPCARRSGRSAPVNR